MTTTSTTYAIPDPPDDSTMVLTGTDGSRWRLNESYGLGYWERLDVAPGVISVRVWARLVFEQGRLTAD